MQPLPISLLIAMCLTVAARAGRAQVSTPTAAPIEVAQTPAKADSIAQWANLLENKVVDYVRFSVGPRGDKHAGSVRRWRRIGSTYQVEEWNGLASAIHAIDYRAPAATWLPELTARIRARQVHAADQAFKFDGFRLARFDRGDSDGGAVWRVTKHFEARTPGVLPDFLFGAGIIPEFGWTDDPRVRARFDLRADAADALQLVGRLGPNAELRMQIGVDRAGNLQTATWRTHRRGVDGEFAPMPYVNTFAVEACGNPMASGTAPIVTTLAAAHPDMRLGTNWNVIVAVADCPATDAKDLTDLDLPPRGEALPVVSVYDETFAFVAMDAGRSSPRRVDREPTLASDTRRVLLGGAGGLAMLVVALLAWRQRQQHAALAPSEAKS